MTRESAARRPGPADASPRSDSRVASLGIYLHIPYCRSRCHYCAFTFLPGHRHVPADYLDVLVNEADRRAGDPRFAGRPVESVYFGGGTPGLLDAGQFARLLQAVRDRFPVAPDAEISLEANPEGLDQARMAGWRKAGANRLTLGWQSVRARHLRTLTRTHSPEVGYRALELARSAGFENMGVDLIFGLPGQTPGDWREELEEVAAAGFEHVSAYELTFEEGTRLTRRRREGRFDIPAEAARVAMFRDTEAVLATHGIGRYEISNFARDGRECVHNLSAWHGGDTLGLGVSAASHVGNARWKNPGDLESYRSRLAAGREWAGEAELLDAKTWAAEDLYLGLRTAKGVDAGRRLEAVPPPERESLRRALASARDAGLVEELPGRWRLTARGLLFADSLFETLLDA